MSHPPLHRAFVPSRDRIVSTSDVDGVNTAFGYWGPLSYPMRRRLHMAAEVMARAGRSGRFSAILDGGYGCGILLPDLYRRLTPEGRLFGIDMHDKHREMHDALVAGEGMAPERLILQKASLAELPFADNSFDLVVSISVLEHIPPALLPACLREIRRVTRPGGLVNLGFPTDCLFIRMLAALQKQDLAKNHPSTHRHIFHAIEEAGFAVESRSGFPLFWGPLTMHYNVSFVVRN